MEVSYGSLFIYYGSYLTKPVSLSAWAWAAAPHPVSFRSAIGLGWWRLKKKVLLRPINPNRTKGTIL